MVAWTLLSILIKQRQLPNGLKSKRQRWNSWKRNLVINTQMICQSVKEIPMRLARLILATWITAIGILPVSTWSLSLAKTSKLHGILSLIQMASFMHLTRHHSSQRDLTFLTMVSFTFLISARQMNANSMSFSTDVRRLPRNTEPISWERLDCFNMLVPTTWLSYSLKLTIKTTKLCHTAGEPLIKATTITPKSCLWEPCSKHSTAEIFSPKVPPFKQTFYSE